MRLQEDGPSRKRLRETLELDQSDSDLDDEALPIAIQDARHRTCEDGEDEDESEVYSDDDSLEEESETEAQIPITQIALDDLDGLSSRVSFAPRTAVPIPPQPPSSLPTKATSFASFGITPALLSALNKISIRTPTEIQSACIPPLLEGKSTVIFIVGLTC